MLRVPRANTFRRNPMHLSATEARKRLLARGGDDPAFVGLVVDGDLNLEYTQIRSLPAGLQVGGHLYLRGTKIQSLPAGLQVGGDLGLGGTKIQSLPAGLSVGGNLELDHTPIESLPAGLKVVGYLYLDYSQIQSLPADLKVGGSLALRGTNIKSLPEGLQVGGGLLLDYSKIESLPAGLVVGRTLSLVGAPIQTLPPGLRVGEDLLLYDSNIQSLPEGLVVGGDLNLSHTQINSLPAGLVVGRHLNLLETRVRVLPPDIRVGGYIDGFDFPTPPDQIFPITSYGKMTGTILKLNKPDAPQTLTELKQRYPNEFERFRSAMTNANVGASPKAPIESAKKAVEAHSRSTAPWLLTYGVYDSGLQRYCKSPNKVIKLNIDISKYEEKQQHALGQLAEAAKRSGHPYETGDLFTIGWVRICEDDKNKIWLIEEIQSDVQSVRHKEDLSQYPDLAAAEEVMAPIAKRFYHDILGVVFDKAEKIGYTVQMLDYPAKRRIVLRTGGKPPPQVNYTFLPQDMGMRLTSEPSPTLPEVGPVWSYKPNPNRRRRGSAMLRIPRSSASRRNPNDAKDAAQLSLMRFLARVAVQAGVADHVYVVGGAVRDFVLGLPIKDVDIVVDAVSLGKGRDSAWFAERVVRAIPTAASYVTNQYGVAIITVKGGWLLDGNDLSGEVIEIANARKESYSEGGSGKGYKPTDVQNATIEEDVERREFTFNTLLWRMRDLIDGPATAPILDLTGHGLQDLRRGLIRCPKNPDIVFSDDPTRMLRLVKFVGRYGFSVAPEVAASVQRNASKMAQMPYEAIGTILVRDILQKPYAVRVLPMMQSLGLISALSGIAAQNPSFRTYLTRELRTLPIGLILALWRSGLQDPTPLSILSPEQQAQFVQVAQQMTEEEAQFLLDRLRKPPVDNEVLIKAFSLRPAERGQLAPLARNLMLADPTLDGQRLTSAMAHILSTRA